MYPIRARRHCDICSPIHEQLRPSTVIAKGAHQICREAG
jgi:hypothetical protein